ncbi:MAG: hypothetical protein M3295_06570 [Chloroflexota bacterium]|nr:hypothetical protein [Chloroflexota bacterium]
MDVLFQSLSPDNFPDLFTLLWITALLVVIASVAIYIDSGRRYRRYPVLIDLHEWVFWSVVIPWGLALLLLITHVPLALLLLVLIPGMAVLIWARFVRFPPLIAAAGEELRRRRFAPAARPVPAARPRPTPAGRRRRHSGRR